MLQPLEINEYVRDNKKNECLRVSQNKQKRKKNPENDEKMRVFRFVYKLSPIYSYNVW